MPEPTKFTTAVSAIVICCKVGNALLQLHARKKEEVIRLVLAIATSRNDKHFSGRYLLHQGTGTPMAEWS